MRTCAICLCTDACACAGGCAWLPRADINGWLLPIAGKPVNVCTRCTTIFLVATVVLGAIVASGNRPTAGAFLNLMGQPMHLRRDVRKVRDEILMARLRTGLVHVGGSE